MWNVLRGFPPPWRQCPSAGRLHKSNGYLLATSWASRSDVLLQHISVTHASVPRFMSRCPWQLHNDKVITRIILALKLHVLLRPLHAPLPCEFVSSNAVIFIFLVFAIAFPLCGNYLCRDWMCEQTVSLNVIATLLLEASKAVFLFFFSTCTCSKSKEFFCLHLKSKSKKL